MTSVRNTILVTGGAGFIGSNFVLQWIESTGTAVINLDLLTYAGNPDNLAPLKNDSRHQLMRGDICDAELVAALLQEHRPRQLFILQPKAMWTARLLRRTPSFAPTYRELSLCLNRRKYIGQDWMKPAGELFASCISLLMKSTDHSAG